MTDSWKTDGNCNECCRKNYCNVDLPEKEAMIYNAFRQTTGKACEIMKIYDFPQKGVSKCKHT